MQNKGTIRLFAVLLALICLWQLSFTLVSRRVESKAASYANNNEQKELQYLDSVKNEVVYNLGFRKYTYQDVKSREINLGLDLRGGMNVTLEVSVVDLVRAMSNYSKDVTFNQAIERAKQLQANSQDGFIDLFGQAFKEIDPNAKLASYFLTPELKEKINYNSTNEEVLNVLREEADAAIDNSFNILRTRIDRFGVAQPNVQKLSQRGRILVELPGVKDKERVRNLLQGTASLEFWETYENQEVYPYLNQANLIIKEINEATATTVADTDVAATEPLVEEVAEENSVSEEDSLLAELGQDSDSIASNVNMAKDYPLFSILQPNVSSDGQLYPGPVVGIAHSKDTMRVREYLNLPRVKANMPRDLFFSWQMKPFDKNGSYYQLIALKITTKDGRAPLDGGVITDARQDFGQNQSSAEVNMNMNSEGSKTWARMTKDNLGRSIAIVLDGAVVSYPTVQSEITGGRSNITGNFTIEEAKDLANMLKSGKMPAPATIVEEYVVGPSLGQESINSGMWSFVIAFLLVLVYMFFFYSARAGLAANIALITNLFFLIGVLSSFGAVLTLPGIAGIVLTMGMAVDANVLIFERTQEELRNGKGLKLAIQDGYRNAYSAIIDGQVTTLLTGIVLYFFGSGPIKGFATTLIIGICTSLFTAIFITRLILEYFLKKERKVAFSSKFTAGWLQNLKINFLGMRKYSYIISGCLIGIALISFAVRGFDMGIDFKGGRTYVIEFKEDVKVNEISNLLAQQLESAPEVKTFGGNNQVRITTDYKIEDQSTTIDNQVEELLYAGLQPILGSDVDVDEFRSEYIQSSTKVGPTISDDIQKDAFIAIALALIIIFLYILIRFRNWQYGLGAISALAHDAIIILGAFSLLSGFLPFSLEIDQSFIAAILTVLGYSINDTVVIFDRIRENVGLYPKRSLADNMNNSINGTLRRTFSTSLSTLIVLLAIFIFGGDSIRGFTFALLLGVIIGTYSSIFVATPIAFDSRKKVKE